MHAKRCRRRGRVNIRLATVTLDHEFVVSHPKVRPGAHVLITIEEMRGRSAAAADSPADRPVTAPRRHAERRQTARESIGPLVALIGEVGGHLWMSAEPAGNI